MAAILLQMGAARLLITGALGAGIAACSLLYGGDLEGSHDGIDTTPETGAPEGGDPGATDASSDASGPADVEGGGLPRGCAAYQPAPKFCDDFDGDGPLGAKWDNVLTESDTDLEYDATRVFSQPRSLEVQFDNAGDCSYGRLERTFTSVGLTRQEVHFAIQPASTPWGDVDVFAVNLGTAPEECMLLFSLIGDDDDIVRARVNAQQGVDINDVRDLDGVARMDVWTDFGVVLERADGGGVVLTTTFDRGDGLVSETVVSLPQCKLASTLQVRLGVHCGVGDVKLYYDDVRVDWR